MRSTDTTDVPDHEQYRGYGVMALPFDTGHVLALRVMPENDYVPFEAVWHRTPDGRWSMYVDAPHHEELCPRLFGPSLERFGPADISVSRPDRSTLEVRMERPRLHWTIHVRDTLFTRLVNCVLPRIPGFLFGRRPILALVRTAARTMLGLGEMDLAGELPGGQRVAVRPRRIRLVSDSRAVLEGLDLGRPTVAEESPRTGSFRWPARGVLADGEIRVAVDDPTAHRRRLALFHPFREARREGNP